MKMIKIKILIAFLLMLTAGCTSKYIITKYDKDGIVTEVVETNENLIATLSRNNENKSVLIFRSGWVLGAEASFISEENVSPYVKVLAGNQFTGYFSILKEHQLQDIPSIMAAINKKLKVDITATGVGVEDKNINKNKTKIKYTGIE